MIMNNQTNQTTLTPEQQQKERDDIAWRQRKWDEYLRRVTGGPPVNGDRYRRMISWEAMPLGNDPTRR